MAVCSGLVQPSKKQRRYFSEDRETLFLCLVQKLLCLLSNGDKPWINSICFRSSVILMSFL